MISRLPETQREEFLKKEGVKIFESMSGRPMREYVRCFVARDGGQEGPGFMGIEIS